MKPTAISSLIAALLTLAVSSASAQAPGWTAFTMMQPYPSPYFSDWQNNPTIGSLNVYNHTASDAQVRIFLTIVRQNGTQLGRGVSGPMLIPRGQLPTIITMTHIIDWGSVKYDKSVESFMLQTGRFPEGYYTACVTLKDLSDNPLVENVCANFTIVYPDPPYLVLPTNGNTVDSQYPVFQWTPLQVPPVYQLHYVFRLVELLPGQVPAQALASNVPYYENASLLTTSLQYPIDAFALEKGKTYVWQVQALDQNGFPPAANNGKSEIWTFTYKKMITSVQFQPMTNLDGGISTVKGKVGLDVPGSFTYPLPPLKNAYLQLVVGYKILRFFKAKTAGGVASYDTLMDVPPAFAAYVPGHDLGAVLDETTTDDKGQFTFSFKSDSMGVLANKVIHINQLGPAFWGTAYRYAHVVVGSSYISSPPNEIVVQPAETKDVGTLIARDMRMTVLGNLNYEFADPGEYVVWPLKNRVIKLVVKYAVKGTHQSPGSGLAQAGEFVIKEYKYAPDDGQVLDVTTTGSNGNFTFSFIQTKPLGLVENSYSGSYGAPEFPGKYQGDVWRVARIILDDAPQYLNPDVDIIIPSGQQIYNAGQVISLVRSYALTVTTEPSSYPKDQAVVKPGKIPGQIVYLLRKLPRPAGVPGNEGKKRPPSPSTWNTAIGQMEVIGMDTTAGNGAATFRRLVKNAYPGDMYYLWAKSRDDDKTYFYGTPIFDVFADKQMQSDQEYNNEYQYPTRYKTLEMSPKNPRISGQLTRARNQTVHISDAQVKLIKHSAGGTTQQHDVKLTGADGRFEFMDLPVEYQGDQVTSYVWILLISRAGYRDTVWLPNGLLLPMKPGMSAYADPFTLEPAARVHGKVAMEGGMGVEAYVTVGQSVTVHVSPVHSAHPPWDALPGSFSCGATTGLNKVVVDAGANYIKTVKNVFISQLDEDLGTIIVYRKMHRARVFVHEPGGGEFPKPIKGVSVRFDELNLSKVTNVGGIVEHAFENADSNFTIIVKGPSSGGQDYEERAIHCKIPNTASWTLIDVWLKKATHFWGHVYVGTEKKPVATARVYIPGTPIEGTTDTTGYYYLSNVPFGWHEVIAVKGGSGTIGDNAIINATETAIYVTFVMPTPSPVVKKKPIQAPVDHIDFNLKVYDAMDITHLMGFPIEVASLTPAPGGAKINGSFVSFPTNPQFSSQTTSLSFNNVTIIPSATQTSQIFGKIVPVAEPKQLPVPTALNEMDVLVYGGAFKGKLVDKNIGIELHNDGTGLGVIKGKVFIKLSSFGINGFSFSGGAPYLTVPGPIPPKVQMRIPVITASGKAPIAGDGIPVVDSAGVAWKYSLYGFNVSTNAGGSYIHGDTLAAASRLQVGLKKSTPVDINIGAVRLHPSKVELLNGASLPPIKLDQWDLLGKSWVFTPQGFFILKGDLDTKTVFVPFDSLRLTPTDMVSGPNTFKFTSMNLLGVVPMQVTGEPGMGFDDYVVPGGAWKLWVSNKFGSASCAWFSGLPGMADQDTVFVNAFYLTSSGKKTFSLDDSRPALTLHKVAAFHPLSQGMDVIMDYVSFKGTTDFHVPGMPEQSVIVQYTNNGGILKFLMQPFWFQFPTNGVMLTFAVDTLDERGFIGHGNITEPGKPGFNLKVTLFRTPDSTSIWVDTPPVMQQLAIGAPKTTLQYVVGSMRVPENVFAWDDFWFEGDLTGTQGVLPGQNRLHFTVIGEIKADGQGLGIKNATSFGGMSFTYEFENSRLIGHVSLNKTFSGIGLQGDATIVVDGSGWFFFAGGNAQFPGGFGGGAAILIGDYPTIPDSVKSTFAYYSYKKALPCGFQSSVSGFLISGNAHIPVIVPSIGVDLFVVSLEAGIQCGGDVRLWMSFANDGNEYGIGVLAFVHVFVHGSAITCTSFGGDLTLEMAVEGKYQTNPGVFSVAGCGSIELKAWAKQQGVGLDDVCTPPEISFDKSIGVKADISMSSSGDFGINFGLGTCSGASYPCGN